MSININHHYGKFGSKLLHNLFRSPVAAIASHWMIQSLFYVSPTERWFKIFLEVAMTLGFTTILKLAGLGWSLALLFGWLVSHTINFLFNGSLWCVLKHYGLVNLNYDEFLRYTHELAIRVRRENAIHIAYVYGSFSRNEWTNHSDLDIRFLRKEGFINGWSSCWFLLLERTRSLFTHFPLDGYVIDDLQAVKNIDPSEKGIDLILQDLEN